MVAEEPHLGNSPATKRALLIGCTKYDGPPELYGPANDVQAMAELLQQRFGFEEQNVTRLAGWPDDTKRRPTHANIIQAFKKLIDDAAPGDQVVVMMNGHGLQLPAADESVDGLEFDGLDEYFLPSDAQPWKNGGIANSIRDNQIGQWLSSLREKGVHAWVIFDCCHSGTLTKGSERRRGAAHEDLQVPADLVSRARARALRSAPNKRETRFLDIDPNALRDKEAKAGGKIVAFYACQPFEETPELPRPRGAPKERKNYHGLLSYTIVEILSHEPRAISYAELSRRVVQTYRAERKSRGPTPFAEGPLGLEVLGVRELPAVAAIRLRLGEGVLILDAGTLRGVSKNTVLAVYATNSEGQEQKLVGHVQVVESSPLESEVTPCEFDGIKVPAVEDLLGKTICRPVFVPLGDWRIKLAIDSAKASPRSRGTLTDSINALPPESLRLIEQTEKEDADFVLQVEGASARLVSLTDAIEGGEFTPQRLLQTYQLEDAKQVATGLSNDIRKIFRWQSVWRLANAPTIQLNRPEGVNPKFSVDKLLVKDGKVLQRLPLQESALTSDDILGVSVDNKLGKEHLWVTVLFLDAHFGIQTVYSGQIAKRKSMRPVVFGLNETSFGVEGFVGFAVAQRDAKDKPLFEYLAQKPLGHSHENLASKGADQSPFAEILQIADGEQGAKGIRSESISHPAVFSQSWITLPSKDNGR